MKAPLDYANPGPSINLAVARVKATGPGKRIGSLLVNPGGPGGSAVDYLQSYAGIGYPAPVRARYDMVAVDPRGVARSEPVECLTGKEMDAYTEVDQTPDDPAEQTALAKAFKDFANGCDAKSAKVLPHVSTVEAARDMDILRASARRPEAVLRRRLVRHVPRGDVRGALPLPHRPTGPRRCDGPVPLLPGHEPRPDGGLRDGVPVLRRGLRQAEGLPAGLRVRRGRLGPPAEVLQGRRRQSDSHRPEPQARRVPRPPRA